MKKQMTLVAILFITAATFAQKAKVLEGDFKDLKGISEYTLVFDYSDLEIPKYDSEEEFLADKMKKREDKNPGSGEKFKEAWFDDREELYEPKFIESFNKRFDNGEVKVGMNMDSAEYVMKVHTTFMYAGYNIGFKRKASKINAVISIYKKGSPASVIFKIQYTKAEGNPMGGKDFESGYRIAEAYAKLAKTLAKTIKKKAK